MESEGHSGRTNVELHALNVKENADKTNAELFRAAEKYGSDSKAAWTLRARGINYP
jgi:hypothetical protein